MIVKSEAIEPKASSATSIYPAVIINVSDPSSNNAFVYLQVFCPDVMSGTLADAKYFTDNWIEAPRYPHNGADAYDFEQGGIVVISFQDGNTISPQFIRYVTVSEDIINYNKKFLDGTPLTSDQPIIDISDSSVTTDTDILQKGMLLLPALEACGCGSENVFHTYGYDGTGFWTTLEGTQYLTIYRCGKYGTEFVYKQKNKIQAAKASEANFDYLDDRNSSTSQTTLNIFKYLLNKESIYTEGKSIIDIVNKTIIEFETDSKYKKNIYDKANDADVLFWYTKLAGYIYDNVDTYDMSTKLSSLMRSSIKEDKLKVSTPDADSKLAAVLNNLTSVGMGVSGTYINSAISLYHGTLRTEYYGETKIQYIFEFVGKLWKNLCNSSYFGPLLESRYAIVLSNNLFNLRNQYNVSKLSNKLLVSLAVIQSAFPTLDTFIRNMDLALKDEVFSGHTAFVSSIKEDLKAGGNFTKITKTALASGLANLYFLSLGWPYDETKSLFEYQTLPHSYIYNKILAGIDYVLNHYDNIKSKLDSSLDDTDIPGSGKSQFVWPAPNMSVITSPFGPRNTGIAGASTYHQGIDIAIYGNALGQDIIASMSGTVEKVVSSNAQGTGSGYGNYILLKHNDSLKTRYAHLLNVFVKQGDSVKQGQKIATCDNTGTSSGSHLHFEIIMNDTPVNPLLYVSSSDKYVKNNNINTETSEYYNVNLSHDIQDYLFEQCKKYNIPSALMIALIQHESGFNPNAISKTGDYGLCQINKSNHEWLSKTLGVTDFLDPKQNILCGCYVLSIHLRNYNNDYHKSLMAYNMGAGGAKSAYWDRGIYTSAYSIAVMQLYDKYRE